MSFGIKHGVFPSFFNNIVSSYVPMGEFDLPMYAGIATVAVCVACFGALANNTFSVCARSCDLLSVIHFSSSEGVWSLSVLVRERIRRRVPGSSDVENSVDDSTSHRSHSEHPSRYQRKLSVRFIYLRRPLNPLSSLKDAKEDQD